MAGGLAGGLAVAASGGGWWCGCPPHSRDHAPPGMPFGLLPVAALWHVRKALSADVVQGSSVASLAWGVGAGVLLQLGLAAPFLMHAPASYLSRAFEFSRCGSPACLPHACPAAVCVMKLSA